MEPVFLSFLGSLGSLGFLYKGSPPIGKELNRTEGNGMERSKEDFRTSYIYVKIVHFSGALPWRSARLPSLSPPLPTTATLVASSAAKPAAAQLGRATYLTNFKLGTAGDVVDPNTPHPTLRRDALDTHSAADAPDGAPPEPPVCVRRCVPLPARRRRIPPPLPLGVLRPSPAPPYRRRPW